MSDDDDLVRIGKVLEANKGKTFIDRILHKDKYPTLNMGAGYFATHLMAWGEADGKYRVYPTVLWDGKELKRYNADEAYKHVVKSGNYIDFDKPEDADWFSKNYKKAWGREFSGE